VHARNADGTLGATSQVALTKNEPVAEQMQVSLEAPARP